jgi:hypothetical protein
VFLHPLLEKRRSSRSNGARVGRRSTRPSEGAAASRTGANLKFVVVLSVVVANCPCLRAGQPIIAEAGTSLHGFSGASARASEGRPSRRTEGFQPSLRFPIRPYPQRAVLTPRRITLINGDTVTVELLGAVEDDAPVRMFGEIYVRVPLRCVQSIHALAGERELVNVDVEAARHADRRKDDGARIERGEASVTIQQDAMRIGLPAASGDVRCWFRFRALTADAARFGWSLEFADGSRLRVAPDSSGQWRADAVEGSVPLRARQTLPVRTGWQIARWQRLGRRFFLAIDDQLLASGAASNGKLTAVEFFGLGGGRAAPAGEVEHLCLVETTSIPVDDEISHSFQEDRIFGVGGETWWGRVRSIGPAGVAWSDGQTEWQRTWRDVSGAAFATNSAADPVASLAGNIVRIELQSSTDRPDLPGDRLTVALGPGRDGFVLVDHPLIGRLAIPPKAIRRVERRFRGEWLLLGPRAISVGVAAPIVEGTFSLKKAPRAGVFFSLDASGMEPSGRDTPRGSPHLKSLRAGRMATDLWINDRRIGNFNALTSQWSHPGGFDRLRLPVPAGALQRGENTFRIVQERGPSPQQPYNECRLRNLSLEIEPY